LHRRCVTRNDDKAFGLTHRTGAGAAISFQLLTRHDSEGLE
jgi:hypothetical protein